MTFGAGLCLALSARNCYVVYQVQCYFIVAYIFQTVFPTLFPAVFPTSSQAVFSADCVVWQLHRWLIVVQCPSFRTSEAFTWNENAKSTQHART